MSLFILDTDILTLFQEGHPSVCAKVASHASDELAISVLSVEEQLSGWYTQIRQAKTADKLAWAYGRLASNVRFLSRLSISDFNERCIERYENLRKLKIKVRKMDLRIAAIVLEKQAVLVTRNSADFENVPGLTIEDWSQ